MLITLLLASVSFASIVGPRILEQDDNGDISLKTFMYSLSADCNASTINLTVMDASLKPVQDARALLKYVDFSTPTIGNVMSDKDGYVLLKLPGNVQLMRGLFVLVIEKHGYRNKEVHFDLAPCYPGYKPPAPKPAVSPNITNQTKPTEPKNQTIPPKNNSLPKNETNKTGNGGGTGDSAGGAGNPPDNGFAPYLPICAAVFALPLILLKTIKGKLGHETFPSRGSGNYSFRMRGRRNAE